jgi:ferredoxin
MNMVEVALNQPCCSGCLACVELAPEIFAYDEVAQVAVILKNPCMENVVRKVAAYCPDNCIEIIE